MPDVEKALPCLSRAVESRTPRLVVACFAADGALLAPQGQYLGPRAIAAYWRWALTSSTQVRCNPTETLLLTRSRAVQEGTYVQHYANGIHIAVRYSLTAVTDTHSRIARLRLYFDQWEILRQIAAQTSGAESRTVRRFLTELDRYMTPT